MDAMVQSFERKQSVAIVGGGPGGYEAALSAAQLGADVTLVERAGVGGSAVITDEQKELLAALPSPEPTRGAMISVHLAYAEAYLPRARRLAKVWGVDWPDRFEQATWNHLRASLSLEPPYALTGEEA